MTSLHIAEISGMGHNNVMRAIRNMEKAWTKVTERNFALSEYKDASGKRNPMYKLTFDECMYIGSKFNDEARATLVVEWDELRNGEKPIEKYIPQTATYAEGEVFVSPLGRKTTHNVFENGCVYSKFNPIMNFINYEGASGLSFQPKAGLDNMIKRFVGKSEAWFINAEGFTNILKTLTRMPSIERIDIVYRDCFRIEMPKSDGDYYTYKFTDSEMLLIYEMVNKSPINKSKVIDLLSKGKGGAL